MHLEIQNGGVYNTCHHKWSVLTQLQVPGYVIVHTSAPHQDLVELYLCPTTVTPQCPLILKSCEWYYCDGVKNSKYSIVHLPIRGINWV